MATDAPIVCVTGATGFIAAHTVKMLLAKGHRVRGTVRSLGNAAKLAPLRDLPRADELLELVEADMMKPDCFDAVLAGCSSLIHMATPIDIAFDGKPVQTMEEANAKQISPAVDGTTALLKAAAKAGIRKVVLTSSIASMRYQAPPPEVLDESQWSNEELMKSHLFEKGTACYCLAKTLQERAAWNLADELGFKLIVINPALVIGPSITTHLNFSLEGVLKLVAGEGTGLDTCPVGTYPDTNKGYVDVREVAEAHVLAFEKEEAEGRYLLQSHVSHYADIAAWAREHPKLRHHEALPLNSADGERHAAPFKMDNSKMKNLGIKIIPAEQSVLDSIESLVATGFVK